MRIKSSKDLVDEASKQIETLNPSEVKVLLEKNKCTLIDVRDIRELWKEGTVKNSKHIPRGMLEFWLDPQSSYYKEGNFSQNKKLINSVCRFDCVDKVKSKNIDQKNHELTLELIGIDYLKNENNFEINLIFKDNSHIALTTETIEVRLEDQNEIKEE